MRTVKALLSDEAHATLDDWYRENGITAGSFLEAVAEMIGESPDPIDWRGSGRNLVRRAREIAYERRRRQDQNRGR